MTQVQPVRLLQQLDGTFVAKTYGTTIEIDDDTSLFPQVGGGSITAINNAAANRLVTIGAVVTELDAEANLTFDGTTLGLTGSQTISGTLLVTGILTTSDNIVSDTDSTDDLGTVLVRWANVFTDNIGDVLQPLTILGDALIADTHGLVIGHTAAISVGNQSSELQLLGTANPDSSILLARFDGDAFESGRIQFLKSATGTIDGGFTVVENNELVGAIIYYVDDGVDYSHEVARIEVFVDDLSIAAGAIGGALVFSTATTAGTVTVALRLSEAQLATFAAGAVFGGNVISDTDSTDDLGTTLIAWANLWVDTVNLVGSTSGDVSMVAPAVVTPYTLTWPAAVAGANQVLTDAAGNGILSWATPASGAVTALNNQAANRLVTIGAVTTELDGEALMTFDGTTFVLGNATEMVVGHTSALTAIVQDAFQILGNQGTAQDSRMLIARFTADGSGPAIDFLKSQNGTIGSNTIVNDNDIVGRITFLADDGVDFATQIARISCFVDDPTPAAGLIGSEIVFETSTAAGALSPALRIRETGVLEVSRNGILVGGDIDPDTDSSFDLGSASLRYANVFTDSLGDAGQNMTYAGTSNIFNNFLRPAGIDTTDVGQSSSRFRRGHFNQIVTVETFLPTTASIRARNTTTLETDMLCLSLESDDSNAGVDGDTVYMNFILDDDAQTQTVYAEIRGVNIDATAASTDGAVRLQALATGSMAQVAQFGHSTAGAFEFIIGAGTPAVIVTITQTFATADATHAARTSASTAAPTDYVAHASGGVTVTSAAATDLDTTAAALDTLENEFTTAVTNLNAVRTDLDDTAQVLNSVVDALQAHGILA